MLFEEFNPMLEMANLNYNRTGLDYPVWVSYTSASHGPRVKVSNLRGKTIPNDNFSVQYGKSGNIEVSKDTVNNVKISNKDLAKVFKWVTLNFETLMNMWYLDKTNSHTIEVDDNGIRTKYTMKELEDKLKRI